jgi:hypothetical protein
VSGTYNTAVGHGALYTDTDGDFNTAVGAFSLWTMESDATGQDVYNTAVGYKSGYALTSGILNTFVGGFAGGGAAVTGDNNTFVGYSAGNALTGGGTNVGVGMYAGDGITDGAANICIGYDAGSHSVALATGTGNILIGAYTDTNGTGDDYVICIGYNVDGAADYTTIGNAGADIRAAHGVATWNTVSDERYKKNITDSTAGLSFINDLRPRTFKYKNLGDLPEAFNAYEADSTEAYKNSDTNHGFIAQEVKTVIDAHSEIKDGFRFWGDRPDGSQELGEAALIPVLVKAIQELSAEIDKLKA